MADDDSTASASANSTSDPSALGEALGSISAAPALTPPKPASVVVRVKQEDVALVVSPILLPSSPLCLIWVNGGAGGGEVVNTYCISEIVSILKADTCSGGRWNNLN